MKTLSDRWMIGEGVNYVSTFSLGPVQVWFACDIIKEGFEFIDILTEIRIKRDFASFFGRPASQLGLICNSF
jgi:hypothetical protein